jgi:tetratricopeptide (TPR) repeat protein
MMIHKYPFSKHEGHVKEGLQKNNPLHSKAKANVTSPQTHDEQDLWADIGLSMKEPDVQEFREVLRELSAVYGQDETVRDTYFYLSGTINKADFLNQLSGGGPDLNNISHPLPKIHVQNHHRANGETIHPIYREEMEDFRTPTVDSDDVDEEWNLIGEAVSEKDIISLRESLQHLSETNLNGASSLRDIEMYLEGNMDLQETERFENELEVNNHLKADLELYQEIGLAMSEKDILELRSVLEDVTCRNHSSSRDLREIEDYVDALLPGEELDGFSTEMEENDDLKSAVILEKELRTAIREKGVMELRDNLRKVSVDVYTREEKSFLPLHKANRKFKKAGTVAAVLVLATGLSFYFQYQGETREEFLGKYLKPPQSVSSFRSAESSANQELETAFRFYNQVDYHSALQHFGNVLELEPSHQAAHFYSGASYQGLTRYNQAIHEYNMVLNHNDNIFVDQAEWYRALCYVRLGEMESAYTSLEAIETKNGYFARDARRLLKKLR